jgi:hypothetical protein
VMGTLRVAAVLTLLGIGTLIVTLRRREAAA